MSQKKSHKNNNDITRREAVSKLGKYAALTAIGTLIVLNPSQAQTSSPPDPGGNDLFD